MRKTTRKTVKDYGKTIRKKPVTMRKDCTFPQFLVLKTCESMRKDCRKTAQILLERREKSPHRFSCAGKVFHPVSKQFPGVEYAFFIKHALYAAHKFYLLFAVGIEHKLFFGKTYAVLARNKPGKFICVRIHFAKR